MVQYMMGYDDAQGDMTGADIDISKFTIPMNQFSEAVGYFVEASKLLGLGKVFVTGHSLGGALAAMVGCLVRDTMAVTFNAPGTQEAMSKSPLNFRFSSVYNFRANYDPVSKCGSHVGVVHTLDIPQINKHSMANLLDTLSRDGRAIKEPPAW